MTSFECKRCGSCFKAKHGLIQHLEKQIVCTAELQDVPREQLIQEARMQGKKYALQSDSTGGFPCPHCHRVLSTKGNCMKHEAVCKSRPLEELMRLREEVQELRSLMQKQQSQPSQVVYNNGPVYNGPVYQQANQINLRSFGQENTDHITDELKTKFMLGLESGFVDLVKCIHFDEQQPENQNIRYRSAKQNILEVFEDDTWVQHDAGWVLDNIVAQGYKILSKHFIEHFDKECLKDRQEFVQRFLTHVSNTSSKSKIYYGIRREIFIMIKHQTDSSSGTLYLMAPPDDASDVSPLPPLF